MKPAFQRRAFWSFAGFALLGLAGWQSVALAGRQAAGDSAPPLPARTRSGERPLLRRETAAGDPVAHYLARAKRGMTEREVRWMIEDFEAAGLDRYEEAFTDFAVAKALRKKQEEWYLAALCEGLSFTPEQKEGAQAKLAALFARDLQRFEDLKASSAKWRERNPGQFYLTGDDGAAWKKSHPEQSLHEAETTAPMYQFCRFSETTLFADSAFTPWNLTQVTEEQSSLTLRFWLLEAWKQGCTLDPFADTSKPEPDDWLYAPVGAVDNQDPFSVQRTEPTLQKMPRVPAMQDPVTGNLTQVPDGMGDLPDFTREDTGQLLSPFLPCGNILPLTPDQEPLLKNGYDWAAQALLCHPAQLRLALLQRPDLAKVLREELDLEPSQRGLKLPPKSAAPISSE